jgi:ferredoxin/flavodoxin---NADP+ reductase
MARILSKRDLTPVTKLLVIEAPLVSRNARAGQFVMLRVNEEGERVPVTITDFNRKDGTITIVVQVVGKTTAMICSLEEGEEILDFVGPLGRPVSLPNGGHVALIGGGFGAGAIYTLASDLTRRGVRVSAIIGARNKDLLILQDEMGAVTNHLHICTDDGSAGHRGFVTEFLRELLDAEVGFTSCYAIGPIAMMRALAEVTRPYELTTMVSLDPIMVDGTGMCGACRVTVGGELKFACVDGPFFDAHEVDFSEAVVRSKMYVEEQELAARLVGLGAEA